MFTSLKSVMTNIEGLGLLLHWDDNDDDNDNDDDRSIYWTRNANFCSLLLTANSDVPNLVQYSTHQAAQ